jgi:preprotein translocase subunit SecG
MGVLVDLRFVSEAGGGGHRSCSFRRTHRFYHAQAGSESGREGRAENGLRRVAPGVYGSRPMYGVIIAVHVLVSLFLIFVILLQPGRADGMAAFGGGGGASSVFGGRGSVTFLAKVTEVCAAIFMITSLTLAYRSSHTDSVLRARRNIAAQEAQKQGPVNPPLPTGQTAPAPATGGAAVPVPGDQAPGPAAPSATPPAQPPAKGDASKTPTPAKPDPNRK